jgi:alpha-ketoglutarate-dependent taurine dioxygenase
MQFTTRRLGQTFGCEIVGLRLWEKIDADTVEALRALWRDEGVLVFRRQALSEHEFADFCALFGALELTVRRDWASNVRPEVGIISNLKDATGRSIGGLGDQEVHWHSDQSYIRDPATGAGLYAVEIAYQGGTTRWAHLAKAYEALPERLKGAVEGKQAIFDYSQRLAGYKESKDRTLPKDQQDRTPAVVHPLVHAHPVTGRKSLYLDPTTMIGIVGMDDAAAAALVDELAAFATQREFVYEHHWQVGDALIWDNGFLLHQRDDFPPTEKRLMKRTTMMLPRDKHMVPAGALASEALSAAA